MIKIQSDTWLTVERWARCEELRAVERLIAGGGTDEQLRGRILALRQLQALPGKEEPPVEPVDTYST